MKVLHDYKTPQNFIVFGGEEYGINEGWEMIQDFPDFSPLKIAFLYSICFSVFDGKIIDVIEIFNCLMDKKEKTIDEIKDEFVGDLPLFYLDNKIEITKIIEDKGIKITTSDVDRIHDFLIIWIDWIRDKIERPTFVLYFKNKNEEYGYKKYEITDYELVKNDINEVEFICNCLEIDNQFLRNDGILKTEQED